MGAFPREVERLALSWAGWVGEAWGPRDLGRVGGRGWHERPRAGCGGGGGVGVRVGVRSFVALRIWLCWLPSGLPTTSEIPILYVISCSAR